MQGNELRDSNGLKLMAIWAHDTYPGFLYGYITDINEHGNVELAQYGKGKWFKPLLILPACRLDEIQLLHSALRNKKQQLEAAYLAQLHDQQLLTLPGEILTALELTGKR